MYRAFLEFFYICPKYAQYKLCICCTQIKKLLTPFNIFSQSRFSCLLLIWKEGDWKQTFLLIAFGVFCVIQFIHDFLLHKNNSVNLMRNVHFFFTLANVIYFYLYMTFLCTPWWLRVSSETRCDKCIYFIWYLLGRASLWKLKNKNGCFRRPLAPSPHILHERTSRDLACRSDTTPA